MTQYWLRALGQTLSAIHWSHDGKRVTKRDAPTATSTISDPRQYPRSGG